MANIGVILGSIREGRNGQPVAEWVVEQAQGREHSYELVDLKEFNVPLMESAVNPGQANGQYDNDNVQRWADKIGALDAFVFVTPEYNQSVPGPFKNAFDSIIEWMGKPVAFVGYGFGGAEAAVKAWHAAVDSMLAMPYVRHATQIDIPSYFAELGFEADGALAKDLAKTLDGLEKLLK